MHEDYLLKCRAWALFAWGVVALLMAAAWVVGIFDNDDWHIAALLALTACGGSAVAATLHIRSFMVKISTLVRANARMIGSDPGGGSGVHPIH